MIQERVVTKELIGVEDLLLGEDTVAQVRNNTPLVITKINPWTLGTIPTYTSKAGAAALSLTSADAGRKVLITTANDGGSFTLKFNPTLGTYSDNGGLFTGTVFIPIGGDGTLAFVRDDIKPVRVEMFGGFADGSTDDSDAFDLMQTFIESKYQDLDLINSYNAYSGLTVDLTGTYAISREFVLYNGVEYVLPTGSSIKALTAGMSMARNADLTERAAASGGPNRYGCNNLKFTGGGMLDGNNLAREGFVSDTVASGSKIDIAVVRVTNRSTPTTCTGSSGSASLTLASVAGVTKNSVLYIAAEAENEFYQVISLSGNIAVLNTPLLTTVSADAVYAVGVGFLGRMTQQSKIILHCNDNDIGEAWGENEDGFFCTDLELKGSNKRNNIASLVFGLSGAFYKDKTLQHSFDRELVVLGCIGLNVNEPYIESMDASSANTLIPPTGGAPVTDTVLVTKPLIEVKSGASSLRFNEIMHPQGSIFRRLIRNEGNNTFVDGVMTTSAPMNVNPNRAGDYALGEQNSAVGILEMINIRGAAGNPGGFASIAAANRIIVDESGAVPASSRYSWGVISNGTTISGGAGWSYRLPTTNLTVLQGYRDNEAFPRVKLASNELAFGDGGSNPSANLKWGANDLLKTDDQFFADDGIRMKVKAGIPSDADITVVASGVCILDTTNSRIYFRVGATWRYAALT